MKQINPFSQKNLTDNSDQLLVKSAVKGDRSALEELVKKHQSWVYNIALRMVGNPQDAEDITQEILVKAITHLATFKHNSAFTTWLYRITANHVINMKKRPAERVLHSFKRYGKIIDDVPDIPLPTKNVMGVEMPLLVEETRIECMTGMLLCLERDLRLAFILGVIFEVNDKTGSAIMNITRDNFRKKLSRGRVKIANFMNEKCGLIRSENACHCHLKTMALINRNDIDPKNLKYNLAGLKKVKSVVRSKMARLDNILESKCRTLYRNDPFQESPDFVASLKHLIEGDEFRKIMNLTH